MTADHSVTGERGAASLEGAVGDRDLARFGAWARSDTSFSNGSNKTSRFAMMTTSVAASSHDMKACSAAARRRRRIRFRSTAFPTLRDAVSPRRMRLDADSGLSRNCTVNACERKRRPCSAAARKEARFKRCSMRMASLAVQGESAGRAPRVRPTGACGRVRGEQR